MSDEFKVYSSRFIVQVFVSAEEGLRIEIRYGESSFQMRFRYHVSNVCVNNDKQLLTPLQVPTPNS